MSWHQITNFTFVCSRSPWPSRVPAPLQKAQADPHGVLPLAAAQAGAGLREQPVRGGPGEEGARQDTALVRDPGNNDRHGPSLFVFCLSVREFESLAYCSRAHICMVMAIIITRLLSNISSFMQIILDGSGSTMQVIMIALHLSPSQCHKPRDDNR